MKKWAHYRAKIINLPESKFPVRKRLEQDTSLEDEATIAGTAVSKGAISFASVGGKKAGKNQLYGAYRKQKTAILVVKVVAFLLVIALFVCWYVFWVR